MKLGFVSAILADLSLEEVLQFAALSFDVAFQETFSTLCHGGTLVLLDEGVRKDIRALTDAELETITGGGIFGRIVRFLHDLFDGPGDLRRPTDRPN